MQETWKIDETCETWDESCSAKQLWRLQAAKSHEQGEILYPPGLSVTDERGFTTCNFCGKPARGQLKRCPDCEIFFKGPAPYKPRSIDYECEKCE